MRRFLATIFAAALFACVFAGCGAGEEPAAGAPEDMRPRVVATIFPGYDFTRAVAGENAKLDMLLPPGAESHSFEPTPKDIITIQSCDLFIYTGGESDAWVDAILDSIDTSNMIILPMLELVEAVTEEVKEGMQDEHGEGGGEVEYDEHVWTSPVNAALIAEAIADVLCSLDGTNADIYRANRDAYVQRLGELDEALREITASSVRRTLIFGDRFPFRYLVDEYGLDYFAAFPGCSSETEPSARTVAFLIDKVQAENIPVVFHIEFSNGRMADTICEATGAQKLLLHSCHNLTKDEFDSGVTYVDLMTQNLESLREAIC